MKKIICIAAFSIFTLSACTKNSPSVEPENPPQANTAPVTTMNTEAKTQGDTAENALDWAGEYKGVFPCADCEGIETELELRSDYTYELSEEYLGKGDNTEYKVKGTFSFDSNNSSVITLDQHAEQRKYFIGENFAEARDKETGKAFETKLNYKLSKSMH